MAFERPPAKPPTSDTEDVTKTQLVYRWSTAEKRVVALFTRRHLSASESITAAHRELQTEDNTSVDTNKTPIEETGLLSASTKVLPRPPLLAWKLQLPSATSWQEHEREQAEREKSELKKAKTQEEELPFEVIESRKPVPATEKVAKRCAEIEEQGGHKAAEEAPVRKKQRKQKELPVDPHCEQCRYPWRKVKHTCARTRPVNGGQQAAALPTEPAVSQPPRQLRRNRKSQADATIQQGDTVTVDEWAGFIFTVEDEIGNDPEQLVKLGALTPSYVAFSLLTHCVQRQPRQVMSTLRCN